MQLAKAVFPEPGDPLSKNPLFGGSLLTAFTVYSLTMMLKISSLIFWTT